MSLSEYMSPQDMPVGSYFTNDIKSVILKKISNTRVKLIYPIGNKDLFDIKFSLSDIPRKFYNEKEVEELKAELL